MSRGVLVAVARTVAGAALALAPMGMAFAAGFELDTFGIKQFGANLAGAAAYAPDATALGYNPAGMMALHGTHISVSATAVQLHGDFNGRAYDTVYQPAQPVSGGNGGDFGGDYPIPAFFMTRRVSPRWALGLGLYSKYDTVTDYRNGWTGRYNANLSSIKSADFNPVVAFKATRTLSFGAGFYLEYFRARLTNAVDLTGGAAPGAFDVSSDLHGDDITAGVTAGMTWQPRAGTRFGLSYRSPTTAHVSGKLDVSGHGVRQVNRANVDVPLPAEVMFGVSQSAGRRLTLLAGAEWFGWNRFGNLNVHLDNGQTIVLRQNYDNSWRLSGGAAVNVSAAWTLRAGVAYDQSPVNSAGRDARVPDSDRLEVTAGASFSPDERWTFDAGYMHVFFHRASIDNLDTSGTYRLQGHYNDSSDLLGVQADYRF